MTSPREEIIEALKTVMDPELMLDIWFLGLIYDVTVQDKAVHIDMTFTSPMCPAGPYLMEEIRTKLTAMGYGPVDIKIVFSPHWEPSDEVKALLGLI